LAFAFRPFETLMFCHGQAGTFEFNMMVSIGYWISTMASTCSDLFVLVGFPRPFFKRLHDVSAALPLNEAEMGHIERCGCFS